MEGLKTKLQEILEAEFRNGKFAERLNPHGCYRTIRFHGSVVFKLALDEYGVKCNRSEWRLWNWARPNVKALMAPVLGISSCGKVLVMERVKGTYKDELDKLSRLWEEREQLAQKFNEFRAKIKDEIASTGLSSDYVVSVTYDNHHRNIGVREDGSFVWIDYGTE